MFLADNNKEAQNVILPKVEKIIKIKISMTTFSLSIVKLITTSIEACPIFKSVTQVLASQLILF